MKSRIIKAARAVVHPAIYDSGGMAPAEALACGLPGVAFDLPALGTYYPKGFLKAPQGGFPAFAAHLERLLSDEALYRRMSTEARAASEEWDGDLRGPAGSRGDFEGDRRRRAGRGGALAR